MLPTLSCEQVSRVDSQKNSIYVFGTMSLTGVTSLFSVRYCLLITLPSILVDEFVFCFECLCELYLEVKMMMNEGFTECNMHLLNSIKDSI